MKKLFSYILLIMFVYERASTESTNSRDVELNQLFDQLKKSKEASMAFEIEKKIWNIWLTHPTEEQFTISLAIGSNLMLKGQLESSYKVFSNIVETSPDWSEGWNKRATVLYLMGRYSDSLNDINEVLKHESRHFGALSGRALVQIKLKNYEDAMNSYKAAEKIYPFLRAAEIMIPQLQELINKENI